MRLALGLTQAELAAELGVARNTVARWEMGSRPISEPAARLLERLSKERRAKKTKR
jgi:transcriptional regulator with XRE-family HTH domain